MSLFIHKLTLFKLIKIFSHLKKKVRAHISHDKTSNTEFYRDDNTEQFKGHFTDIHKSKIEY